MASLSFSCLVIISLSREETIRLIGGNDVTQNDRGRVYLSLKPLTLAVNLDNMAA